MTKKKLNELTPYQYQRFVSESQGTDERWEDEYEDSEPRWNAIDEAVILKVGGLGLPLKQMAALLGTNGITVKQMEKLYGQTLHKTRALLNANVATMLYEKAMSGDTAALTLWAKTQMGWVETTKRTLTMEEKEGGSTTPTKIQRTFIDPQEALAGKKGIQEEALDDSPAPTEEEPAINKKEEWLERLRNKNP